MAHYYTIDSMDVGATLHDLDLIVDDTTLGEFCEDPQNPTNEELKNIVYSMFSDVVSTNSETDVLEIGSPIKNSIVIGNLQKKG